MGGGGGGGCLKDQKEEKEEREFDCCVYVRERKRAGEIGMKRK